MFWTKKTEPTYTEQLVEAKAKLARAKKLPDSAFTIVASNPLLIQHGIDTKPKRIAELEADIAYLEVKSEKEQP